MEGGGGRDGCTNCMVYPLLLGDTSYGGGDGLRCFVSIISLIADVVDEGERS